MTKDEAKKKIEQLNRDIEHIKQQAESSIRSKEGIIANAKKSLDNNKNPASKQSLKSNYESKKKDLVVHKENIKKQIDSKKKDIAKVKESIK
jgi:hypothetical protein